MKIKRLIYLTIAVECWYCGDIIQQGNTCDTCGGTGIVNN